MSDFTRTPNYQLYKPTPNADNDAWGAHLNTNADTLDSALASGGGGANNVGRNLLHNPLFRVAQRGTSGFTTPNTYCLDRWKNVSTDAINILQGVANDGQRTQVGDEAMSFFLSNTFTGGTGGAASYCIMRQLIESVRRLAGKTVTVSFWASAGAVLKLGVSLDQFFGAAGSPSAPVNGTGQSVTLSTTWTRYSLTFTIASAAGKTLGTDGSDSTFCQFWYSAGSTNDTRSGAVGIQSGTINLWGVQLEIGSVATPLEKPDPRYDLSNCERFFQVKAFNYGGAGAAGVGAYQSYPLGTKMRATPAVVVTPITQTNCGSPSSINPTPDAVVPYVVVTATAGYVFTGTFTASADL